MSWQKGRQLASIIKDGTTISFTYDSQGHRIRKTSGSNANDQTVTRYFYNGDTLIGLVKGNQTVQFVYDTEGRPFLMRVYTANNATPADYYYLYNGQGDVAGLIDSGNSDVVHYTYDSWEKTVSVTDTSNASLSTLNPFRYRGYIYDPETELYYLQSRYYDVEIGRPISTDLIESLSRPFECFTQYNMYGYCFNAPISLLDENGTWPSWATKIAIGVGAILVGAAVVAATAATGGAFTAFTGAVIAGVKFWCCGSRSRRNSNRNEGTNSW